MKIKETYLTFGENGKPERNFCTLGQASCCRNGFIPLKNLIDCLKEYVARYEATCKTIDGIFENWEEEKHLLDTMEEKESNIYSSYYDIAHTILTREEADSIMGENPHCGFISAQFIDKMVELLESKVI